MLLIERIVRFYHNLQMMGMRAICDVEAVIFTVLKA